MKRNFIIGLFGLGAAALLGCPVYSGGGGGTNTCGGSYYGGSGAYLCCNTTADCPTGSYCNGVYCSPSSPSSSSSSGGDCSVEGCKSGEVCAVVDGGAVCIASPDGGAGEGGSTTDSSADSTPPFTGCTSDAACADAGVGYLCLDGACVAPANQCTDAQQCPGGEQCVQGGCVPSCTPGATDTCPTGYSCDPTGVCTGNPTPCGAAADAGACKKGDTCVDEHCVPKCSGGDAACGTGLVCVDDGCIPDQKPVFLCNKDGVQDKCDVGSICLHHACYIACDPEGGTTCNTAELNECKEVTTSSGNHWVCGSSTTLGGECSPTTPCSGAEICIDGYCK